MKAKKSGVVREVAASEIKNDWYRYLDMVNQGREEIILTRYGKPIAKLVPLEEQDTDEDTGPIFGRMRGTVTILGDIIGPIDVEWDANG